MVYRLHKAQLHSRKALDVGYVIEQSRR